MLDQLNDVTWLHREECYRARVDLEGTDFAIVCAMSGGPAMALLEALPRYVGQFKAFIGAETPDDMAGALVAALGDGDVAQEVWKHVDAIIASSLVEWAVGDLAGLPWLPDDLSAHCPNALMDVDERSTLLNTLPVPVIVRLVLGSLWLVKN